MNKKDFYKIGWDVGGAHLKAVLLDAEHQVLQVIQLPCPLWQGIEQLSLAVDQARSELKLPAARHAVTMTGELADLFSNRRHGVTAIATLMAKKLGPETNFYAGSSGFVRLPEVDSRYDGIASANWHASVSWVARNLEQGLFVDVGSTTSDLIILRDGAPRSRGFSDAERMCNDELVYTGVVRTPVMALTRTIDFRGHEYRIAAEHFATTADIYRITGELMETEDMVATADGAEKSIEASMRRLARMLGHDYEDASNADWLTLAQSFRASQLAQLQGAITGLLARGQLAADAPLVAAGAGGFLVQELAMHLQRDCLRAEGLIKAESDDLRHWAGVCFPAYAVGCLMAESGI
jgi:probable H4MPT-linked C1 transfer pathway protein